ncbi:MAG: hypothetical protein V7K38_24150 [Nostoc sp.]|uniref:hypothetical protein n=1 Tax=Nostoc sp. TaxID=1180 RepID=UPI002FFA6203
MISEKIRRGATRVGGFPDLSVSDAGASLALFYHGQYSTKTLIMVRYEFRSNTMPVATTEGTSVRVHQSPTAGNPPTVMAPLQYLILFKNQIRVLYVYSLSGSQSCNLIFTSCNSMHNCIE